MEMFFGAIFSWINSLLDMGTISVMKSENRSTLLFSALGLILVGLVYYCVFGKYRASEIDDAWTASYVWALTHLHDTIDRVFGLPSNIRFFGHIHAYSAGMAADVFGWTKSTFHVLNSVCMGIAALSWWRIARTLLPRRELALLFVVLLFLLEPFLGAAFKARSDAMAFMFISVGAYAAVRRHFLLAAFLVCLGIETHPIALTGGGWVLVFALRPVQDRPATLPSGLKNVAWCLLGATAGFCLYRYLHPGPLTDILAYLRQSNEGMGHSFNALTAHYFSRAYGRFLPELLFLLAGAVLFFYKKRRLSDFSDPVCLLFVVSLALSFILRRANFHYVIFFYPPFMLAALAGFAQTRYFRLAVTLLLVYALSLSGLLLWQNRLVDHRAFDRGIVSMNIPDDGTPVVGPTNAWFVMRDRAFYANFEALINDQGSFPDYAYYIQSAYSVPAPQCARVSRQLEHSFIFNGTSVGAQMLDMRVCREN